MAIALMAAGDISPFRRRLYLLLNGRLALPTLATPFNGASPLLKLFSYGYRSVPINNASAVKYTAKFIIHCLRKKHACPLTAGIALVRRIVQIYRHSSGGYSVRRKNRNKIHNFKILTAFFISYPKIKSRRTSRMPF